MIDDLFGGLLEVLGDVVEVGDFVADLLGNAADAFSGGQHPKDEGGAVEPQAFLPGDLDD